MEEAVSVEGVDFCWVFVKIWGTHHGRCRRWHDAVGEGREGVLVRVLVGVLVLVLVLMLMLVLVVLGAQVGGRAQGGAAVSAL